MSQVFIGIVFLILATLSTSAFSLIMKFSQERGYSVLAVGGMNYLIAALVAGGFTSRSQLAAIPMNLWSIAAASGVSFVLTYLLLTPAMRQHGVTIPTAAVQVSMVIPIMVAALFWHDQMGMGQAVGVLISLLAIFLLAPPPGEAKATHSMWAYLLVPGIFLTSGGTKLAQKVLAMPGSGHEQFALASIWFSAAAIFSIGMLTITGWPKRAGEWFAGAALGLVNLGSLVFTIRTLMVLPATLVFPAISCLSLILISGGAYLFWRERLGKRASVGIIVGVLAVVLVSRR